MSYNKETAEGFLFSPWGLSPILDHTDSHQIIESFRLERIWGVL